MSEERLDKETLRRNFNRAANEYDRHAVLQKHVLDQLIEMLPVFRVKPRCVLDCGSGTGAAITLLERVWPRAEILQLDVAESMLREAGRWRRWFKKNRRLCADAESLPLADGSLDAVVSSLMLQWCPSPRRALDEIARALKTEGLFVFATLGPETLTELRQSWRAADGEERVHSFPDIQWLGNALVSAGFSQPVLASDRVTMTYPDVRALMMDLRHIGAVNSRDDRRRTLTGKARYRRCVENYEAFRRAGVLPATYEIIYGHAWKARRQPDAGAQALSFVPPNQIQRGSGR